MRALFVAGPTTSNVIGLAPLASALRAAGHEVVMAATEEMCPVVIGIGHVAFAATTTSLKALLAADPARGSAGDDEIAAAGRRFGRMAAAMADRLSALLARWRPDVVVAGPHAYAGALAACEAGVPWVRVAITANTIDREGVHPGVLDGLAPVMRRLDVARLPAPELIVDPFPPALRPATGDDGPDHAPMRWVPTDQQVSVEPWMFDSRPRRVLLTAGSPGQMTGELALLQTASRALARAGVEVMVACPPEIASGLRGVVGITRAGWLPMVVLAPTLDLVVHHGGGLTGLTSIVHGVPQVVLPLEAKNVDAMKRMCRAGAGVVLDPSEIDAHDLSLVCRDILEDPWARARVGPLAEEVSEMPLPYQLARQVVGCAGVGALR